MKMSPSAYFLLFSVAFAASAPWCNQKELARCRNDYEKCKLESGPVGQGYDELACACSDQFYAGCVRQSGCAAEFMTECIETLRKWSCPSLSVCGSSCVRDDEESVHVLPVNNYGDNHLRFSVCGQRRDRLDSCSMVVRDHCTFDTCPYWIPPRTFTAVALGANTSMLRMEYCVYDNGDNYHCLENPRPREFYGTALLFPPSIDVGLNVAPFCESDRDCPGSFCDLSRQPPICSPKTPPTSH